MKAKPLTDAAEILYRRYIKDRPERERSLKQIEAAMKRQFGQAVKRI